MTCKEAREYLIPVAANCVLPQYALALEMAMEALERAEAGEKSGRAPLIAKLRATKSESKRQMLDEAAAAIETLEAELREERYRHDRYVDYATERDKLFEQLMADVRVVGTRGDLCDVCIHGEEPLICEGTDCMCDTCTHEACVCHACRNCDRFEWRGLPDHVESDTVKVAGIDRVTEGLTMAEKLCSDCLHYEQCSWGYCDNIKNRYYDIREGKGDCWTAKEEFDNG